MEPLIFKEKIAFRREMAEEVQREKHARKGDSLSGIPLQKNGGAGFRTPDATDMSRMLYHLSYTALETVIFK